MTGEVRPPATTTRIAALFALPSPGTNAAMHSSFGRKAVSVRTSGSTEAEGSRNVKRWFFGSFASFHTGFSSLLPPTVLPLTVTGPAAEAGIASSAASGIARASATATGQRERVGLLGGDGKVSPPPGRTPPPDARRAAGKSGVFVSMRRATVPEGPQERKRARGACARAARTKGRGPPPSSAGPRKFLTAEDVGRMT